MKLKLFAAIAAVPLITACAWTDVRPVSSMDVRNQRGFVIYDQIPVMIVDNPQKEGHQSIRIATIPNMDKPRVVNSYAFLAKNDLKLELENGVLKGASTSGDTTAMIGPLSTAITTALSRFGPAPSPSGKPLRVLPAGIYEIVFDGQGSICGLKPIHCNIIGPCSIPVK